VGAMAIADLVKTTLGPKGMVSQTAVKKHIVAQLSQVVALSCLSLLSGQDLAEHGPNK
jgi:hypothetical protein